MVREPERKAAIKDYSGLLVNGGQVDRVNNIGVASKARVLIPGLLQGHTILTPI